MRALILLPLALFLGGCPKGETVTFTQPCGVISDSLFDVQGATPADTRRIDQHFEGGVEAGCWERPPP